MTESGGSAPGPEWVRLGELMQQRRGALGHKYRSTVTAGSEVLRKSSRTLGDLENAKRTNYSDAMLAAVEVAYEWEQGSIRAILAGGDPTPRRPVTVEKDAASRTRLEAYRLVDGLTREGLDTAIYFLRFLCWIEQQREGQ